MEVGKQFERARNQKEAGNNAYKSKDICKAIRCYHHALLITKALLGPQRALSVFVPEMGDDGDRLTADQRSEVLALEADCSNNLAACLLQKTDVDFGKVITYCDKALSQNPQNVKALYRKGQAYYGLKKYEEALAIFQSLKADSSIKKYIQLCWKELGQQDKNLKETYQRMFAS